MSPPRVQSVDRALEILERLSSAGIRGLRLSQIAESLSVSRSAAWTTLQTLLARGFVAEASTDGQTSYVLGMSLARLGHRALTQIRLGDLAAPYMRDLTASTGLTSRIAVLHGDSAVVIGREDAPGAVQFNLHMGQPELLHSSSVGKALLSAMSDDEVRELLADRILERRTPHTITSIDQLLTDLEAIRRRGYSVDDEEDAVGVVCVGACIRDHRDLPIAALSVTGLRQALPLSRIEDVGHQVAQYADAIASRLSGRSQEEK